MKFQKSLGMTLAATLIAFGASNPAAADTPAAGSWTYDFGTLVTGKHAPSGSATFATLSVSTSNYTDFVYSLTVAKDLNTLFGDSAYINSLSVNTSTSTDPKRVSSIVGDVSKVALSTDNQKIGAVKYDFTDTLGTAKDRLTQGETVQWTTTYNKPLVTDPAKVFGVSPFVLGVSGIAYETIKKDDGQLITVERTNGTGEYLGRIVSSVPEPESYAMLLSGLALVGFIARRRQRSV